MNGRTDVSSRLVRLSHDKHDHEATTLDASFRSSSSFEFHGVCRPTGQHTTVGI